MKINIEKIGEFELFDKEYLSDSIFRFRLDTGNRFSEKIEEFRENLNDPSNQSINYLKEAISKNNYESIGNMEELMFMNLSHSLKANFYFTNGQKVISLCQNENGWEIGKLGELFDFQNVLSKYYPMSKFGLKSMKLETYRIYERAEVLIFEELREIKIESLPLTNSNEIKVQEIYPISKKVYFENKEIGIFESEELDKLTKQIEDKIEPEKLRTCLNCSNFIFSGMSHDMSGGETGYCKLLRDKIADKSIRETITHIWNWCNKFEEKEN